MQTCLRPVLNSHIAAGPSDIGAIKKYGPSALVIHKGQNLNRSKRGEGDVEIALVYADEAVGSSMPETTIPLKVSALDSNLLESMPEIDLSHNSGFMRWLEELIRGGLNDLNIHNVFVSDQNPGAGIQEGVIGDYPDAIGVSLGHTSQWMAYSKHLLADSATDSNSSPPSDELGVHPAVLCAAYKLADHFIEHTEL